MASLDVEECPSEGGLTKSGMTRLSDDDSAVLVSAKRKFSMCQCFSWENIAVDVLANSSDGSSLMSPGRFTQDFL
jgi:hypothetical protein